MRGGWSDDVRNWLGWHLHYNRPPPTHTHTHVFVSPALTTTGEAKVTRNRYSIWSREEGIIDGTSCWLLKTINIKKQSINWLGWPQSFISQTQKQHKHIVCHGITFTSTIMNLGSVWRTGNIVEGSVNSSSATVALTTSTPTKGWLSRWTPHSVCVRVFVCLFVCVGGQSCLRLAWLGIHHIYVSSTFPLLSIKGHTWWRTRWQQSPISCFTLSLSPHLSCAFNQSAQHSSWDNT